MLTLSSATRVYGFDHEESHQRTTKRQENLKGFLRLPTELRLLIFEYVLAETAEVTFHGSFLLPELLEPRIHRSILFTCRQIYNEASEIIYRKTTFRIVFFWPLPENDLDVFFHPAIMKMRNVKLFFIRGRFNGWPCLQDEHKGLEALSNLQSLRRIEVSLMSFNSEPFLLESLCVRQLAHFLSIILLPTCTIKWLCYPHEMRNKYRSRERFISRSKADQHIIETTARSISRKPKLPNLPNAVAILGPNYKDQEAEWKFKHFNNKGKARDGSNNLCPERYTVMRCQN